MAEEPILKMKAAFSSWNSSGAASTAAAEEVSTTLVDCRPLSPSNVSHKHEWAGPSSIQTMVLLRAWRPHGDAVNRREGSG